MKKAVKMLICMMMLATSLSLTHTPTAAQTVNELYVDAQNGDDNHQGTMEQPVQTLKKAQELARQHAATMSEDLTIYIRGGTYVLDSPLTFTGSDSGQNGHQVIWTAYKDENVVVSGGTSISGWTKVEGDNNIWAAPANGVDSRDLYVNGERALLAREECKALEWAKKYLYVSKENLPDSFARPDDLEIVFARKWKWNIIRLASVQDNEDFDVPAFRLKYTDESKDAFTANLTGAALDEPEVRAESMRYLQNAYEFLNEPGEFYLDKGADQVFYIPKEGEDMNKVDAVLGRLENLVVFDGAADNSVKNITFSNINFRYTTWLKANDPNGLETFQASALINPDDEWDREWIPSTGSAVYGQYVDNVHVTESSFALLGGAGIHLNKGSKNSSVSYSSFEKIGAGGIIIGDVAKIEQFPTAENLTENNAVTDNVVNNVANTYRGCTGILVGYTKGTKIEYNTVKNLPYTGISVGWGWGYNDYDEGRNYVLGANVITHNYVENVLTEPFLIDGGGIYTLGRQDGTVMNDNYIDGVHNEYGGIYLDEGSTGFTIVNNVLTNCVRNWLYKGDFNKIHDNYATEAQEPNRDETLAIGDTLQYQFENNDLWDEAAVAAIKEAAGARAKPQPVDPTPDNPEPDNPEPDNPEPDKPDQPGTEDPKPDDPGSKDDFIYTMNDKASAVTVIGKFPADVQLVVESLQALKHKEVLDSIKDRSIIDKYHFERIYDIYMLRNDALYHADSAFQIVIKLDEALLAKNPRVLYISDSGEVTEIVSTIKDGKLIFTTDHNSYYAIVTEKETRNPIANTGAEPMQGSIVTILFMGALLIFVTKKIEDVLG